MRFFSNTTLENEVCRPKSGINLYTFGMEMPGRKWVHSDYRYGNQGAENDNEIFDGAQNLGLREYDERIGRMFSKDPFAKYLPNKSPYTYAGNSPITFIDENGGYMVIPGHSTNSKRNHKALVKVAKAVSVLANERGIDGVVGNNAFVNTFMQQAGVSRQKALEILTYGSGPAIIATNNSYYMQSRQNPNQKIAGMFHRNIAVYGEDVNHVCEFIFVNNDLLNKISTNDDGDQNILSNIVLLVTLWHEGIHFADYLDANAQPQTQGNDIGDIAEGLLFGFRPGFSSYNPADPNSRPNLKDFWKFTHTFPSNLELTGAQTGYNLGTQKNITDFWYRATHGVDFGNKNFITANQLSIVIGKMREVSVKIGSFILGRFSNKNEGTRLRSKF